MGHVHLQVDDLATARTLHADVLGLAVTVEMPGTALFFGADGYHHHIGSNTWTSRGGPAPGGDTATVRGVDLVVPAAERDAVEGRAAEHRLVTRATDDALEIQDPWGVLLRVTSAAGDR